MCVHCSCGGGECKRCTSEYRKRIAELEAALRENEVILTALAMAPEGNRTLVCDDEKLSAALRAARVCLGLKR